MRAAFSVAGEISTFDAASFEANLRALSPHPIHAVSLTVTAASIRVEATVVYLTYANAAALSSALNTTSLLELSSRLGVTVEVVPTVSEVAVVTAAGPSAGAAMSPAPPLVDAPGDALANEGEADSGISAGVIAGAVAGGVVFACIVGALALRWLRREEVPKTIAIRSSSLHVGIDQISSGGGGAGGAVVSHQDLKDDASDLHTDSAKEGTVNVRGGTCVDLSALMTVATSKPTAPLSRPPPQPQPPPPSQPPPPPVAGESQGVPMASLWADGTLPPLQPGKPFNPFVPLRTSQAGKPKKRKEKNVTGLELSAYQMCTCYGEGVPVVLVMLWCGIVQAKGGLGTEGIFRLAGDQKISAKAEEAMAKGTLAKSTPPECLAHLIKSFLRKLPTGLLGKLPSNIITDCDSDPGCEELLAALDSPERACLCWLVRIIVETASVEANKVRSGREQCRLEPRQCSGLLLRCSRPLPPICPHHCSISLLCTHPRRWAFKTLHLFWRPTSSALRMPPQTRWRS